MPAIPEIDRPSSTASAACAQAIRGPPYMVSFEAGPVDDPTGFTLV